MANIKLYHTQPGTSNDVAVFLNAYFKPNEIHAGPLSLKSLPLLIFTALLICMENCFWDISSGKFYFVASFKKSFTIYVASGMMEKVAKDIVMLGNEQSGFLVTEDSEFNAKFYRFIVDHYLPIPGESRARTLAGGESDSEESQANEEPAQKKEKKFNWLRNLTTKFS